MRYASKAHIGVALLLCFASSLNAQELSHPLPSFADTVLLRNIGSIMFDRNANTYNWTGIARVDTAAFGTGIKVSEYYNANTVVIEGAQATSRLKSEQENVTARLTRPLFDGLSADVSWGSLVYTDNRSAGLSSVSNHQLYGGLEYDPFPFAWIEPGAGYRWDYQISSRDRGPGFGVRGGIRSLDLDGYLLNADGQFLRYTPSPRVVDEHFARFGAQKYFAGISRDSLEVGFTQNRREFYSQSGGTIESRIERILTVANLLDYEIAPGFSSTLFINVTNRGLDKDFRYRMEIEDNQRQFNTTIDEFRLDAFLQASYDGGPKGLRALARLSYNERTENHVATPFNAASPGPQFPIENAQEQTKDNVARRTSLAGLVEAPLSSSDRISVSGSASILRYDTPSPLNHEDRDELLVAASVRTEHVMSQALTIGVDMSGTFSHLVYLLGDRSDNNNINRILRLAPRTEYRPVRWFSSINEFEVLANYTVYDFEDRAILSQSFSYRQFGWLDSTTVDITRRIGLDFFSYLKLYDRGQLNWGEFSERPENSFVDRTVALQARFSPSPGTLFAVGLRYFSQVRYGYVESLKTLESSLRSFGPTCMVVFNPMTAAQFVLRGWYEHRNTSDGPARSIANMTMTLNLRF